MRTFPIPECQVTSDGEPQNTAVHCAALILAVARARVPAAAAPVRRLPEGDTKITLSVTEAAKLLGISRAKVYEAVKRGEIPSIKFGSRVIIPRAALERLLGSEGEDAAGTR